MPVFVVLALALLAAAVGMVIVAGVVLLRQTRELLRAVEQANSRIAELTSELEAEAAAASLEADAVRERLQQGRQRTKATTARGA